MNTLFEEILAGTPPEEVMRRTAATTKFELDAAAGKLSSEQMTQLGIKMSERIRQWSAEATVTIGCYGYLYGAACEKANDEGLQERFWEAIGVSRTQAYRSIAVWREFGKTLLEEPSLTKQFSSESLKILAEEKNAPAARLEALELARQGEYVSIKVAKQLQRKHAAQPEAKPRSTIVAKETSTLLGPEAKQHETGPMNAPKTLWSYVGSVVRLIVEPAKASVAADIEAIIRDLEGAIARLRSEYSSQSNDKSQDAA